jgi:molecular chaperone GrpE
VSAEETTRVSDEINAEAVAEPAAVPEAATREATGTPDVGGSLAEAKAEAARNLEGWQRTLAEFQNYKRRTEKELVEGKQKGALDTITRFFPIMDDFERALNNIPAELKGNPWMNGVELILRNFHKILDENNITMLDPVGEMFDPTRHEAVGMDDGSDMESGRVTVTLQKGYASGDRVLRPALVRIAQ